MTDLSRKIKYDYGSIKRFCRLVGINLNTYKVVVSGHGTSGTIANILIDLKYIKNADELKKVS